jgi:glutathione S-transferase
MRCLYRQDRCEMTVGDLPTLWHLKVSHYNEKARWALDHKRVPHVRRAVVPGRHTALAKKISDGDTLPVLVLDGQAIGDSTRIIEALERRQPDPPLYPADPADKRRALELEDFFDEELGPHTRRLVVHHMLPEPELILDGFFQDVHGVQRRAMSAGYPAVRRAMTSALAIDDENVSLGFRELRAAGERFDSELQPSGYLVGDTFTVADLTLAALLSPLVAPAEFPYAQPQRGHACLAKVQELFDEYGLADWTRGIYARHRGQSAEVRS